MSRTPLATEAEVSEYTQVPRRTLQQYRYMGIGPPYVRIGGHVRYRWDDVEAYVDGRTRSIGKGGDGGAAA